MRGLCLMKWLGKTLQNLVKCFENLNTKSQECIFFFRFSFCYIIFPKKYLGLCQQSHRPWVTGIQLVKNGFFLYQRYGWFISSGINPLFLNSIVLTKPSKAFGFNVIIIFLKYVIFRAQLLMLSSIEKKVV